MCDTACMNEYLVFLNRINKTETHDSQSKAKEGMYIDILFGRYTSGGLYVPCIYLHAR